MPSLDAVASRHGGVTLVELVVSTDGPPVRVRIEDRLGGPVWPPRRHGVPEAGWEGGAVECTLDAGETRGLGYATPARPADPPAELVAAEAVPDQDGGFEPRAEVPAVEATAAGVIRALGDPRPPRDAVPEPAPAESRARDGEAPAGADPDAWLTAAAERIERAEALAGARTLAAVGEQLAIVGGLSGARALAERVERDREALRRFAAERDGGAADRARVLADRAAGCEIPLTALDNLVD